MPASVAPNRRGKQSSVDSAQTAASKGKAVQPEVEPSSSKGRPSRTAKSAVLDDPPWASLKPRSKPKNPKSLISAADQKGHSADKAEKRKRAGSAVENQSKVKKVKQAPMAPKASHVSKSSNMHLQRSHRAPNVDSTDDEPDGNYNDSGDDDLNDNASKGSQNDETSSEEETCGSVPAHVLQAEAARIVSSSQRSEKAASAKLNQSPVPEAHDQDTRSQSPASVNEKVPGPPTSDFEEATDRDMASDDLEEVSHMKAQPTGRRHTSMKLKQERPIIHPSGTHHQKQASKSFNLDTGADKASTTNAAGEVKAPQAPTPTNEESQSQPWKPRTELKIYMKSKKTAAINLKEQNIDIQRVIHASYEVGKFALVVGDSDALLAMSYEELLLKKSPFGIGGLEAIALAALIQAADANGYDGEYDIAHRLEQGSRSLYIDPLVDYVAHRLSLIRSNIKKCITLVAPSILGLPTNTYQHNSSLLLNNAFIFPSSPEREFDSSKPFQHPVISKAVESAFFTAGSQYNALGLEFASRLTSSGDGQARKREISPLMIVLASVAVASIIQDVVLGRTTDFAGPQLDSLYKRLLVIILKLRHSKPVNYHKLMHGIYTSALGQKAVSIISSDLTPDDILGEVDWDLIDDE